MTDNILIAKFMKLPYNDSASTFYITEPGYGTWLFSDELLYHKSWDWLMPVIEKIKSEELIRPISGEGMYYLLDVNIDEAFSNKCSKKDIYEAVVKFIKWYNKQKK